MSTPSLNNPIRSLSLVPEQANPVAITEPTVNYSNAGIKQPAYVVHGTTLGVGSTLPDHPAEIFDPTQSFKAQAAQYDLLQTTAILNQYHDVGATLTNAGGQRLVGSWDNNNLKSLVNNPTLQTATQIGKANVGNRSAGATTDPQSGVQSEVHDGVIVPGSRTFREVVGSITSDLNRLSNLTGVGGSPFSNSLSSSDQDKLQSATNQANKLDESLNGKRNTPDTPADNSSQPLAKRGSLDLFRGPVNTLDVNDASKKKFDIVADAVQGTSDLVWGVKRWNSGANAVRAGEGVQNAVSVVDTAGNRVVQQSARIRNFLGNRYQSLGQGEADSVIAGETDAFGGDALASASEIASTGLGAATTDAVVAGSEVAGEAVAAEVLGGAAAVVGVELLPAIAIGVGVYEVGKGILAIADAATGGAASKWVDHAEQAAWTGVKDVFNGSMNNVKEIFSDIGSWF